MIDQEATATAIKTALTTAYPGDVAAYDLDEVPGTNDNAGDLPANYQVVYVERRYVPERRYGGTVTLPGGRLTVRYHGDYIANVREWRRITKATIEDQVLTLADATTLVGPFSFEVEDTTRQGDVGWTGADTFTF